MYLHLILTILFILCIIFCIYNLKNPYFISYINETKNYFLLYIPLTHTYIYKNNVIIGFISKLFNNILIAIYLIPQYRNRNIIKTYLQNLKNDYILTNNKIIQHIIKNYSKHIVRIPYFNLFYIS